MGLKWIPPLNRPTLEWLRDEFVLPLESGDLAGKYNPEYVPYLWGIFAAMDDPKIKLVVMMKAAQVGWTFGLVGFLGKRAECQPGNIMVLFPKDGAAREFGDEKLVTSIRSTPAMSALIDVTKTRKDGNRSLFKKFPGGFIKMVGSNSASNVKSTPAQLIIVEEPDDTSENVKDQGDALRLVRERLKRQSSGKLILGGTPSVDGMSRVQEFIELSNQMILPIRCHDCGDKHPLDWENVSWVQRQDHVEHMVYGKNDTDSAVYACPLCGSAWDDWQRKKNVLDTVLAAHEAGEQFCGWESTAVESGGVCGFKELNELYVCLPGTSLADVVRDYLQAEFDAEKGDESGRIVFANSKLARPYSYKSDAPEEDELEKSALDYPEMVIPRQGLIVTVGVDVQHDRFAMVFRAWGREEESWLLFWGEIHGTVTDKQDPVWDELEKLIFSPIRHESGASLIVSAVSIDSSDGNTSDNVYAWVRRLRSRGVMAVKGSSNDYGIREIFSKPRSSVDTRGRDNSKASRYGLKPYLVGTHKAKDLISSRIKLNGSGPGRMHWYKTVRPDYYRQLLSEVNAPHRSIKNKKTWQLLSGRRNEALDCEVYAMHAARAKKVHNMPPSAWDRLESELLQGDLFERPPQENAPKKVANSKIWVNDSGDDWI